MKCFRADRPSSQHTRLEPVAIARRALGEGCRPAYSECIEDTECTRDQATTQYICKHLRDEGQTCTNQYDECAPATTCTAGRCVASGELGIFATSAALSRFDL